MSGLDPYRRRLDAIDEQVIALLGARFAVCREIAAFKSEHEIPMMQPGRVQEVRARYVSGGVMARLPEGFAEALFDLVIDATCRMEDRLIAGAEPSS